MLTGGGAVHTGGGAVHTGGEQYALEVVGGGMHILIRLPPVRYLAGGVESGFRKVERDKYEARLLQVKGRRNIRVQQVGTHSKFIG